VDHALEDLADRLRDRLLAEAGDGGPGGPLPERIRALVDREAGLLDAGTRADLAARIARRSFGLGPLEPLLADPAVDEIMVNGTGPVWVERGGRLEVTGVAFADEAQLRHAIERILAPVGRRVDEAEPLADARLPDRTGCSRRSSGREDYRLSRRLALGRKLWDQGVAGSNPAAPIWEAPANTARAAWLRTGGDGG
jgi:hypothetical protein